MARVSVVYQVYQRYVTTKLSNGLKSVWVCLWRCGGLPEHHIHYGPSPWAGKFAARTAWLSHVWPINWARLAVWDFEYLHMSSIFFCPCHRPCPCDVLLTVPLYPCFCHIDVCHHPIRFCTSMALMLQFTGLPTAIGQYQHPVPDS